MMLVSGLVIGGGGRGVVSTRVIRARVSCSIRTDHDTRPVSCHPTRMSVMVAACLELAVVIRAVKVGATRTACASMMIMMMGGVWFKVAVLIRGVWIRMSATSKGWSAMGGMATERTAEVARWAAATRGVVAASVGGGVEVVVAGRGAVAVHVEWFWNWLCFGFGLSFFGEGVFGLRAFLLLARGWIWMLVVVEMLVRLM